MFPLGHALSRDFSACLRHFAVIWMNVSGESAPPSADLPWSGRPVVFSRTSRRFPRQQVRAERRHRHACQTVICTPGIDFPSPFHSHPRHFTGYSIPFFNKMHRGGSEVLPRLLTTQVTYSLPSPFGLGAPKCDLSLRPSSRWRSLF